MKERILLIIIALVGVCMPAQVWGQNRPGEDGSFGYVVLDTKGDIAAQMKDSRTVYEVQSTIDLKKGSLTVPPESVLKFTGGLIKNGTVTFDNTYLDGLVQFRECSFKGQLWNESVTLSWFGATPDNKDNSTVVNEVLSICRAEVVVDALYPINKTLVIKRHVVLRGLNRSECVYANLVGGAHYGFKTTTHINAIRFDGDNGTLSMLGISLIGDETLYVGRNAHENDGPNGKALETCGIIMKVNTGAIDLIEDCSIVGFTYGLRAEGRYIEKIVRTYFSACRFGLWTAWTSDYVCEDCHFNTNMLNYEVRSHNITDAQPNKLRKVGAGVLVKGVGMARFVNCKFEFNFIHFIIDEGCIILNLEDCMFDAATHSCIFVYNEKASDNWLADFELHKPAINCINISGNTFARGARCEYYPGPGSDPGSGIVYVREANDRGMNIDFVNNVVVDDIEIDQTDISYEETIFRIYCSDEMGMIKSVGNDFRHCKAKTVASMINGSKGRFIIDDSGSSFGDISHQYENNSVIDIRHTELDDKGRIVIWKTLTDGNGQSADIIFDPTK